MDGSLRVGLKSSHFWTHAAVVFIGIQPWRANGAGCR
jgi:hypothetical protein